MTYVLLLIHAVTTVMLLQDIINLQAGINCRLHVPRTHAGSR